MTLLDRYLAVRLAKALVAAIVSVTAMFVFIDLTTHRREDILDNQVPWTVVLEYYAVLTPTVLREFQVAAIAVLVAFLLVFGRAAQTHEITAMLASGIGLRRFLRVPALIAGALAIGVFVLSETIGVSAAQRATAIEVDYFGDFDSMRPTAASWANLEGGWTCHIVEFDRAAGSGGEAFLLNLQPDRLEQIEAARMVWSPDTATWILESGTWSVYYPKDAMEVETRTFETTPAPIKESIDALFLDDIDSSALTLAELERNIREARSRHVPTHRNEVDWHSRFAQPVLSFIMMWIAVPFGIRLGRGGIAIGLAASVGIGLAYLMVYAASIGLGYIGRVEPWVAAWFANVVFAVVSAGLVKRTIT